MSNKRDGEVAEENPSPTKRADTTSSSTFGFGSQPAGGFGHQRFGGFADASVQPNVFAQNAYITSAVNRTFGEPNPDGFSHVSTIPFSGPEWGGAAHTPNATPTVTSFTSTATPFPPAEETLLTDGRILSLLNDPIYGSHFRKIISQLYHGMHKQLSALLDK